MVALVAAVAPQHVPLQTQGPAEPRPQVVQEHRRRGHQALVQIPERTPDDTKVP